MSSEGELADGFIGSGIRRARVSASQMRQCKKMQPSQEEVLIDGFIYLINRVLIKITCGREA